MKNLKLALDWGQFGGGGGGGGGEGGSKPVSTASSSTSGNNFQGTGPGGEGGPSALMVLGLSALALFGFLILLVIVEKRK